MGRKKRNNDQVTRHPNRNENKNIRGKKEVMEEQRVMREGYDLNWFSPTEKQKESVYSICDNDLTLCAASSGCGKTTTAVYQALKMLQEGSYKKILFVKTANESADD